MPKTDNDNGLCLAPELAMLVTVPDTIETMPKPVDKQTHAMTSRWARARTRLQRGLERAVCENGDDEDGSSDQRWVGGGYRMEEERLRR